MQLIRCVLKLNLIYLLTSFPRHQLKCFNTYLCELCYFLWHLKMHILSNFRVITRISRYSAIFSILIMVERRLGTGRHFDEPLLSFAHNVDLKFIVLKNEYTNSLISYYRQVSFKYNWLFWNGDIDIYRSNSIDGMKYKLMRNVIRHVIVYTLLWTAGVWSYFPYQCLQR